MKDELFSTDFIIKNNEMWFVPDKYPYLCCYDLDERKLKKQIPINCNSFYPYGFTRKILEADAQIVLIPFFSHETVFYENERTETISFDKGEDDWCSHCLRSASAYYDGMIFSFPWGCRPNPVGTMDVLKIDTKNKELEYKIESYISESGDGHYGTYFKRESVVSANKLFLLDGNHGSLIVYDLQHRVFEKEILIQDSPFSTICEINNNTYCICDGEKIVEINSDGEIINSNKIEIEGYIDGNNGIWYQDSFAYSLKYKNDIYMIPSWANIVLKYSLKDKTISKAPFNRKLIYSGESRHAIFALGRFSKPVLENDNLIIWDCITKILYVINMSTLDVCEIKISLEIKENDCKRIFDDFTQEDKKSQKLIHEIDSMVFSLEGFITYIS